MTAAVPGVFSAFPEPTLLKISSEIGNLTKCLHWKPHLQAFSLLETALSSGKPPQSELWIRHCEVLEFKGHLRFCVNEIVV